MSISDADQVEYLKHALDVARQRNTELRERLTEYEQFKWVLDQTEMLLEREGYRKVNDFGDWRKEPHVESE